MKQLQRVFGISDEEAVDLQRDSGKMLASVSMDEDNDVFF